MAEDGGELTMQRLESASVTNPTLKILGGCRS
nr:hypothetical protein [Halopseudomonas aestusnigri]